MSHSQVIGRFVRRVFKCPARTLLPLVLAPALAIGTIALIPANAYAAPVPGASTLLPQGKTVPSTAVAFGSTFVWDTVRSIDSGTTWSADPTLAGNYRWDFVGGGKMARVTGTDTSAVVFTPSTGRAQTYTIPTGYNAVNATYASYDTSVYNMLTMTSKNIASPGPSANTANQVLNSNDALLWNGSSVTDVYDLFALATTAEAAPSAWIQIPNVKSYQLTDTNFLYVQVTTSAVTACSRSLAAFTATPNCIVVSTGDHTAAYVSSITSMGSFNLVDIQEGNGPLVTDHAYIVSSSMATVTPVQIPAGGAYLVGAFDGGSPYVVLEGSDTVPTVEVIAGDGSLTPSFAIPKTIAAVAPYFLAVSPDRVAGADPRDGSRAVPVWSRKVSASGFGVETSLPARASGLATSAGRTVIMGPQGVSVYDRGSLRHTFADQAVVNGIDANGPYVAELLDTSTTLSTKVSKADGTLVQQFPGWSGRLFGSQYLAISYDAASTGSVHIVVHDLTGVAPDASFTLPAGTAGCTVGGLWGANIALNCGSSSPSRVYSYKTGSLIGSTPNSVEALGDGYAVVDTGSDWAVWNLAANTTALIGCSSIGLAVATDGVGHVACSTNTALFWQDYSSLARSAPRLLGVMAPSSVSFADSSTRWVPEFDTTKALKPGKIIISASDGTVVRAVATAGSTDGSIRGFGWDGRNSYGQGVPPGVYTYRLQVDGADGSGTAVSVGGSGPATGTVTVTAAAESFSPGAMVSLSPYRLLDTRITGPKLGSAQTRPLQVTGVGGVAKSGVSAVVLNVTVTETTSTGYLTVSPTGIARPLVSNLNWSAGATIPNAVTVKVGPTGSVDLYQSGPGTAQVIVDVAGYYISGTVTEPGGFAPITPARILDSRTTGGKFASNETRDLTILGAGGLPASNVSAVVLNVTVTETTANGYLTVFPSATIKPLASNLNWTPGLTIPNLVTVQVGVNGKVSIYEAGAGTSQVIVDVAGYYLGGTPTQPGMFVALSPARVLDTRATSAVPAASALGLTILGAGGIPASGVAAVVINTTVTDTKAPGYLTVFPGTDPLPTASNVNWSAAGTTIPNLVTVQVGADGSLNFYNGSGGTTQVIADTAGYYLS
jgi:hypothetical protein